MLKSTYNYMLTKDDVGKAKPSTRDLPAYGHAFGMPPPPNEEGVGAVTQNWQFHKNSRGGKPDKDFKKLNKAATHSRIATAHVSVIDICSNSINSDRV